MQVSFEFILIFSVIVATVIYCFTMLRLMKTSKAEVKVVGKYKCYVCGTKFDGDVCPKCGWIREEK